ncbi:hypothetical protein F6V30_13280 [Oryzomonas sagensis]|uniref:DUF3311 domain-containing protein n=1 Tax=Oryzomonas sagensis TaxID=2603857 RepID=A0ABQ6TMR3_9BACT|nr:hypothetical protein [Oryzomonas sagensis]KAB0669761.1 hypothetical protein F6V30_13280 [Oryzomonas sagensis]
MTRHLRHKLLRRLQFRESWVIFFVAGFIMMNFPFLHIFNKPGTIFGYPFMFLYFYLGWAASIFIIYLFTLAVSNPTAAKSPENKQP